MPGWVFGGYPGWKYKRVLSDANSTKVTNFQVLVSLTSSNFTFANAKSDGSDVRFLDATTDTALPYWIESYDSVGQTAKIWVKVADIAHVHEMYYGKADATDESNFANVFTLGSDFTSDTGSLTVNTAGGGLATRLAKSTGPSNIRHWKAFYPNGETKLFNAPGGYVYYRDFGIVRDLSDRVLVEGGKMVAYFSAIKTAEVADIFRTESTDGITWSAPASAIASGPTPYEYAVFQPTVLKFAANDYRMWAGIQSTEGGEIKIGLFTSTDNSTWTYDSVALTKASFNTPNPTLVGVPWITPLSDNTYVLAVEGKDSSNAFYCYAATSADAETWTAANSGNPILSPTAAAWDGGTVANPKVYELSSGNFLLQYNGQSAVGNYAFGIGYATATSVSGPWTKDAGNPYMTNGVSGNYGVEDSGFAKTTDGSSLWHWHQYYSGAYNTGSIWGDHAITDQGILLRSKLTADGVLTGQPLSGISNFVAETRSVVSTNTASITADSEMVVLGLMDSATLPSPAANTTINPMMRLYVSRLITGYTSTPGDVRIIYVATNGSFYYWNGLTWTLSVSRIASAAGDFLTTKITDDGTNYVVGIYKQDGTTVASASIAKASVKAFANERTLFSGEGMTSHYSGSMFHNWIRLRSYAATEPSIAVGEEQSLATGGFRSLLGVGR